MYKLDITYSWDDAEEGMQFTSFQKAWEKAKEMAGHLRYWSNGMGELHCHGKREITQDDLPETLKHVYQELWNSGAGCPEYVVEYDGEYYLAVFCEYVIDTYLDALSRAEKLMY